MLSRIEQMAGRRAIVNLGYWLQQITKGEWAIDCQGLALPIISRGRQRDD